MKDQEKEKTENQPEKPYTTYTLSDLNNKPGRIVRDVLRTQKMAVISEYGQEVAEISPRKSTQSEPKK